MTNLHHRFVQRRVTMAALSAAMGGTLWLLAITPAGVFAQPTTSPAALASGEPPRVELQSTRPSTQAGGAGIDMPPVTRPVVNPLKGRDRTKSATGMYKALTPISEKIRQSVAVVEEKGRELALATVVRADGYLLTKASELGSGYEFDVRMPSGVVQRGKVLAIADNHDLALVKVEAANLVPVAWGEARKAKVGEFVFAPGPQREPLAIGVVSVGIRASTGGAIGVQFNPTADSENGILVDLVSDGMPAKKAGIKPGDRLQKINDQEFKEYEKLTEFLQSLSAGTEVSVTVLRGEETIVFRLTLASRSKIQASTDRSRMQNSMGSILSKRSSDFAAVLQHDTVLMAAQQGGPLVDLDGKTIGINIARAGRVETYAIPAEIVEEVLPGLIDGKYPKINPAVAEREMQERRVAFRPTLEAWMRENRKRADRGEPPLPRPELDFSTPTTQSTTQAATRSSTEGTDAATRATKDAVDRAERQRQKRDLP